MTAIYLLCYGQELDPFQKVCMYPSYFPYSPGHHESYSLCAGTRVTPGATADAVRGQGQVHVPCMENSSGTYKPLK